MGRSTFPSPLASFRALLKKRHHTPEFLRAKCASKTLYSLNGAPVQQDFLIQLHDLRFRLSSLLFLFSKTHAREEVFLRYWIDFSELL